MTLPASTLEPDLYDELIALPENLLGEIIGGQIYTQPRPAGRHAVATSSLQMDIGPPFHKGRGGPGGWWILAEPEVHFVRDTEVVVPDLAGWRRERMPRIPDDQRFLVVPDWVCEVLSPSTTKKDRIKKMPLYARYGVGHLWLVDPLQKTLEVYALEKNTWVVAGLYKDDEHISAPPFQEITIRLAEVWGELEEHDHAKADP